MQHEAHALEFGGIDFFGDGRHFFATAAIDELDRACAAAERGARAVDGRVAAADHHHPPVQGDRPLLRPIEEIEPLLDTGQSFVFRPKAERRAKAGADEQAVVFGLQP